jgi:hypothetical protein
MTQQLSPAAKAVWSSYEAILEYECTVTKTDMKALAAALRAVTKELKYFGIIEKNILAIAAELEGSNG